LWVFSLAWIVHSPLLLPHAVEPWWSLKAIDAADSDEGAVLFVGHHSL
jgi:hypothetical protein